MEITIEHTPSLVNAVEPAVGDLHRLGPLLSSDLRQNIITGSIVPLNRSEALLRQTKLPQELVWRIHRRVHLLYYASGALQGFLAGVVASLLAEHVVPLTVRLPLRWNMSETSWVIFIRHRHSLLAC